MLIEFQADNLQTCYVNPARVDAVLSATTRFVEIYVGGAEQPLTIRGDLFAVVKKINDALKK